MPRVVFIVPGHLDSRTGGYVYDRQMVAGLRARGWSVDVHELDSAFPRPTAAALTDTSRVLGAIPSRTAVIIDGLAFGAMPAEAEREAARLRLDALVHLSLAATVGLDQHTASTFEESERRAVRAASLVIVTGRSTVATMERYGVSADRLVLVQPGVAPGPPARGSSDDRLELLCVASLNRGKGHDVLIEALTGLRDRNWRLTCAGSLERDPATADRIRERVRANGLEDRVSFAGELGDADLARRFNAADIFVLPTLFETYGMAVGEALAHGLPVVSTNTGAILELVGDQAGIVVAPGDPDALRRALALVMDDTSARQRFAAGARRVSIGLPTWDAAVDKMAAALKRMTDNG
jgi:glycosyltransferase involved in cell wall biosynthesis